MLEETATWFATWVVFLFFEVLLFFLPFRSEVRPRPPTERPEWAASWHNRWVGSGHDRWYSSALYLVGGVLFVVVVIVGGYVLYVAVAAVV